MLASKLGSWSYRINRVRNKLMGSDTQKSKIWVMPSVSFLTNDWDANKLNTKPPSLVPTAFCSVKLQ